MLRVPRSAHPGAVDRGSRSRAPDQVLGRDQRRRGRGRTGGAGSPARLALRRLARKRAAVAALVVVALLALAGILAPLVAPYDPLLDGDRRQLRRRRTRSTCSAPTCSAATSSAGRVYGARVSLAVAFAAVSHGLPDRRYPGAAGRLLWRWLEMVIMRAMDMLLAFPGVFLALIVVALLGTG